MDERCSNYIENGSTTKDEREGTYTAGWNRYIRTRKSFTGTGTGVTGKRVDKGGTPPVTAKNLTVTPVTPTAEPSINEYPR